MRTLFSFKNNLPKRGNQTAWHAHPKRWLRCAAPPHSKSWLKFGESSAHASLLECGGAAQRSHRFGWDALVRRLTRTICLVFGFWGLVMAAPAADGGLPALVQV